jgi:hypothetical protein
MNIDTLYTGYCPEDVEEETTTKYCHCQIGKGDNCGPFNYYTDCSPPLKNKKGKRRGKVIVFLLKSYTW